MILVKVGGTRHTLFLVKLIQLCFFIFLNFYVWKFVICKAIVSSVLCMVVEFRA